MSVTEPEDKPESEESEEGNEKDHPDTTPEE